MSSQFQKPYVKKIPRSDWQAKGPPYITARYTEKDAVIANSRSDTVTAYPSDHSQVNIGVRGKLAKKGNKEKDESNTWKKSFKKPTEYKKTVSAKL